MKKLILLCCIFILISLRSISQTIPIGSYTETLVRMHQVLGTGKDSSSFTQRPLNSDNSVGDDVVQTMVGSKNLVPKFKLFGINSSIKILPATWLNEYNSRVPYGYNNGPMYPNAGYQTMFTGGVFIKAGIFKIQFKPELVYAQNKPFSTFGSVQANGNSRLIGQEWYFFNAIDAPERFGAKSIQYAGLGQSKFTINLFHLEAGISTENMWWGPGVQNSIMMSNSAPGFPHWTFNTTAPVKTIIGSFEWQIIGGVLKQSGYEQYAANSLPNTAANYAPKPKVDRYISGFTFNWHPKWIEGFSIGFSGYEYLNRDSTYNAAGFIKKTIPVIVPINNVQNTDLTIAGGSGQDYAYAINMRQVFPKEKAEFYFEYARNDNFASITDLILQPDQAGAYTLGAAKFITINKYQFLKIAFELTHLQIPENFLIRPEPYWYLHPVLSPLDGYTNKGRFVGAGIGTGSNSLMLDVSWINKINSFGVKFERLAHDNDLYFNAFKGTANMNQNWVDISNTFYANIKLKGFLVSAEYTPVYSYNYEYLQNYTVNNNHARITLTYFFN
jgi:hypothetical protein